MSSCKVRPNSFCVVCEIYIFKNGKTLSDTLKRLLKIQTIMILMNIMVLMKMQQQISYLLKMSFGSWNQDIILL